MKTFTISIPEYEETLKPLIKKYKWDLQWTLHTPSTFRGWFEIKADETTFAEISEILNMEIARLQKVQSLFDSTHP